MINIAEWLRNLSDDEIRSFFKVKEKGCIVCPAAKRCRYDGKETCAESIRVWATAEAPDSMASEDMLNTVVHPDHYNFGSIEVIDAIDDWGLNFELGNVVKYVARAEHKGKALEDLKKAQWYLDREIERRTADGDAE